MLDVPKSVVSYLVELLWKRHSLAFLLVKKSGKIATWGGSLAEYGIKNLIKGVNVSQQIFFLEGLLPLDDSPIFIPRVKTDEGICADLHLFPSKEGDWVILLDATLDEMQLSLIQQYANSKILAKEKVSEVLKPQSI